MVGGKEPAPAHRTMSSRFPLLLLLIDAFMDERPGGREPEYPSVATNHGGGGHTGSNQQVRDEAWSGERGKNSWKRMGKGLFRGKQ